MDMYAYVCICMCVYVYVYVCAYGRVCICICVCTCSTKDEDEEKREKKEDWFYLSGQFKKWQKSKFITIQVEFLNIALRKCKIAPLSPPVTSSTLPPLSASEVSFKM